MLQYPLGVASIALHFLIRLHSDDATARVDQRDRNLNTDGGLYHDVELENRRTSTALIQSLCTNCDRCAAVSQI
jgi:hypothetical protein